MVSLPYQERNSEIVSSKTQQEYNEGESSKETLSGNTLESSGRSSDQNQSNAYFIDIMMTKNNEIISTGSDIVRSNSSSPTTKGRPLASNSSCPLIQKSFNVSRLNIQNIQPTQGPTPAATPTQKLSPRLNSVSEQNVSQSRPELESLLHSHQHLPLQQQQYSEHIFGDQYRLQQIIQSQESLGQMVSTSYCHQHYQLLTDGGEVAQQQIEQPSTSFLQPYQLQNVLHDQHNVQKKLSQFESEDERQKRRLERNRAAARHCRERRKVYVSNLESKVTRLEAENARLRRELSELNAKLQQIPVDIQEGERLYFLTEELKARLQQQYQRSQQPLQQQQSMNESNSLLLEDIIVKNEENVLYNDIH